LYNAAWDVVCNNGATITDLEVSVWDSSDSE
jgi:hypothetical protein